jgi:hypothetical protein
MQTFKEMKGVCLLFSETGTEGGWWAMREDGLVTEDGDGELQSLEEGDDFTVYADDGSVLFQGVIHKDTTTGAVPRQVLRNGKLVNHSTWKQQVVGGMWVHWVQSDVDPEIWGELFVGDKRCLLRREESTAQGAKMARDTNDVIGNLPVSRRRKIEKRASALIANLSQGKGTTGDEISDEARPSARERSSDNQLAADLGALGYPGFRYLSGEPRDPAEVLLDALDRDNLDARVVEALPWLPVRYPQMNWPCLVAQVKLCNRQNRLGFIVNLSARVAVLRAQRSIARSLYQVVAELRKARLAKDDTLCQAWWPPSQRRYAHEKRSRVAAYWNIDTRLTEKDLAHAIDPADR